LFSSQANFLFRGPPPSSIFSGLFFSGRGRRRGEFEERSFSSSPSLVCYAGTSFLPSQQDRARPPWRCCLLVRRITLSAAFPFFGLGQAVFAFFFFSMELKRPFLMGRDDPPLLIQRTSFFPPYFGEFDRPCSSPFLHASPLPLALSDRAGRMSLGRAIELLLPFLLLSWMSPKLLFSLETVSMLLQVIRGQEDGLFRVRFSPISVPPGFWC